MIRNIRNSSAGRSIYYGAKPALLVYAKLLRRNPTVEETLFWKRIKGRRIEGVKFRRQHPIQTYIVDFYCHELKLVVEIDGPVHMDQLAKDQIREQNLKILGLTIVRYSNIKVSTQTFATIQHLTNVVQKLSTNPSPRGEGREG